MLTGIDRKGKVVPELTKCAVHTQGALAFAAHPTSFAQAPGGVWEYHDLMQPIHGMEAWNGTLRYLANKEESPFDHWQRAGDWSASAGKKGIDRWDEILRQRAGAGQPSLRPAGRQRRPRQLQLQRGLVAGLGRLPRRRQLPGQDPHPALPAASRPGQSARCADRGRDSGSDPKGSCVVTDGPVVNAALTFAGRRATLGQVLETNGDGVIEVEIQAASTSEFGQVERGGSALLLPWHGQARVQARSVPAGT